MTSNNDPSADEMAARPTVLVVEDETDLVELYEAWLSPHYETLLAYGGREALDILADNEEVDVVVLDRRMPEVKGDEVLLTLKEWDHEASVVMVTAVDAGLDLVDLPIDEYIEKPVTKQVVLDAVQRMVRLQRASPAVREYHSLERRRDVLQTARSHGQFTGSDEYQTLLRRLEDAGRRAGPALAWLDETDYDRRDSKSGERREQPNE